MTPGDLADLVRLPAVLSVPGDAWLGAAAAGARASRPATGGDTSPAHAGRRSPGPPVRAAAMPLASAMLYLGGMALNDWADRALDARERPERPIPSGRIPAGQALGVGAALVGGGVAAAGLLGGVPAASVASALAGTIVLYDVLAKDTPAGPAAMAACRGLDVLLGASAGGTATGGALRAALPSAAVVAAHTATVTAVSRHEVAGAPVAVPASAAAATAAVALAAACLGGIWPPEGADPTRTRVGAARAARGIRAVHGLRVVPAVGAAAVYARGVGGGYLAAARAGGEATAVRQAVGSGVMGVVPLQAALLAGTGALVRAALVAAAIPLGRALRRRRAVT